MSEVPQNLKSSQSEPAVHNTSIQEGGDEYMTPSEVNTIGKLCVSFISIIAAVLWMRPEKMRPRVTAGVAR
jgi:hypothetical protein